MSELFDRVVPDVVCFASLGEARALVADLEELQTWLEVWVEFANSRIEEVA
jgi:hypothetical protein